MGYVKMAVYVLNTAIHAGVFRVTQEPGVKYVCKQWS